MAATTADMARAYLVDFTFNSQKNGWHNEKLVHGRSGNGLCYPVKAMVWRILYNRKKVQVAHYIGTLLPEWTLSRNQSEGRGGCSSPGYAAELSSYGNKEKRAYTRMRAWACMALL
jgi:hypothetical protein